MTEMNAAVTPMTAKRRYIRRRNGKYPPLKVILTPGELVALCHAARTMNRSSPQQLAADLLARIINDRLYTAVLDEA